MGHLINPIGFHVGYFSNWIDLWFSSHNLLYSDMLHSTVGLRKIMSFFFENGITDRYSILYSHFTVETLAAGNLVLKMYFYDGIVEQKMLHLAEHLQKFTKIKRRSHKRLLRRFRKLKPVKLLRIGFLKLWRYYDYILARRIIFFLIYLLKLGYTKNMTDRSFTHLVSYYYKVFSEKWFLVLKKRPNISVFAFIKYYLKYLAVVGFTSKSSTSNRLHFLPILSNFCNFFSTLDKLLFFWVPKQNFLNLAIKRKKFIFIAKYKKFISSMYITNKLGTTFFMAFYRSYLLRFRQAKFFKLFKYVSTHFCNLISVLPLKLEFFGLDNDVISATFLARYVARKIEMRFQIKELFAPIKRELKFLIKTSSNLLGYKIQFTGRLTRRGKVKTTWLLGGYGVPVSTMSAQIEHSFYLGILRNGVCCVRVWFYRHKSFGNFNYSALYKLQF